MTKEEKINILKKMMWMNFYLNFGEKTNCIGLCTIFEKATQLKYRELRNHIPEITIYANTNNLWWWPTEGRFVPWWERHKAIWKTIKHLKNS